jgi:predicted transposase YdaD
LCKVLGSTHSTAKRKERRGRDRGTEGGRKEGRKEIGRKKLLEGMKVTQFDYNDRYKTIYLLKALQTYSW